MDEDRLLSRAAAVAVAGELRLQAQALVGELAGLELIETGFPNRVFCLGNTLFFLESGDWVKVVDSYLDQDRRSFLEVIFVPGMIEHAALRVLLTSPGACQKVGELRLYPTYGTDPADPAQLGRQFREILAALPDKLVGIVVRPEEAVSLIAHLWQVESLPVPAATTPAAASQPSARRTTKARRRRS